MGPLVSVNPHTAESRRHLLLCKTPPYTTCAQAHIHTCTSTLNQTGKLIKNKRWRPVWKHFGLTYMTRICNLAATAWHGVKKSWSACQPPKTRQNIRQRVKRSRLSKFPSRRLNIFQHGGTRELAPRRLELSHIKLGWTRRQHSWTSGTATYEEKKTEQCFCVRKNGGTDPMRLSFCGVFKLHKGWFLCKFPLLSALHTEHQSDCCAMQLDSGYKNNSVGHPSMGSHCSDGHPPKDFTNTWMISRQTSNDLCDPLTSLVVPP